MDKYLSMYSKPNKEKRSVKNDEGYIKHLEETFSGMTIDKITPEDVSNYKSKRIEDGAAPQTVRHEMNCLSQSFNLAIDVLNWIKINPCVKVKKPTVKKKKVRWLTKPEEAALALSSQGLLRGQLPDIITTAHHTGLRKKQILELKWSEIDMVKRTIHVMQSKTDEEVTIPMSDTLYQMLLKRSKVVSMSGYVFTTENGTPVLPGNLDREFWKALKRAGIENFRFHDLRHTFGTRLIQSGVDIYTVSKLMGHTNIETTTRYAHLISANLKSAVSVLDNSPAQNDVNPQARKENNSLTEEIEKEPERKVGNG